MMQTTLSGTVYVYQGEEIGMRNVPTSWDPSEYKDVEAINYWNKMNAMYPDNKTQLDFAKTVMQRKARDNARTPVQWSGEANAGFCDAGVEPWMRVNDDYKEVNAEAARKFNEPDQLSVLQFWKRALANRKEHKDVFVYGDFLMLDEQHDKVMAYKRMSDKEAFVTVLNFSGQEVEWALPQEAKVKAWVAGNYTKSAPEKATSGKVVLRPWEALLGECFSAGA